VVELFHGVFDRAQGLQWRFAEASGFAGVPVEGVHHGQASPKHVEGLQAMCGGVLTGHVEVSLRIARLPEVQVEVSDVAVAQV
jgi:hypothetical protein